MSLKVSIITICYNNEKEIAGTIESVIGQSYSNIEYLIIDGHSHDRSVDIIKSYGSKVTKWISEPDVNLYDAINKGLKLATGDIVGLIHAGDRLFNSGTIEKIADHFSHNDSDIIYGHSIIINSKSVPVRINKSPSFKKESIKNGWMPSHQSIYLKRKLLEKHGYYDISLHPSSDYEFFLRYFYFTNLKIRRIDEFIVLFATGGRSTRNYFNNLKAQKQHITCWRVNGEEPPYYLIPFKLLRKPIQFIRASFSRVSGKYYQLMKNDV